MCKRKIDAAAKREVEAIISMGSSLAIAAKYIGVNRSTLWREMKRDADFASAIEQAQARNQVTVLQKINEATDKQWRAGAWLLERLNPEDFRMKKEVGIDAEKLSKFLNDFTEMVFEEIEDPRKREKIIKRLEEIGGITTADILSDRKRRGKTLVERESD